MKTSRPIGLRWTIGDVSARGFEALRLSIHGAWRIFGADAAYTVYVNNIDVALARQRTGDVPAPVAWHAAGNLPQFLVSRLGDNLAEGVAWKFAPLRLYPDRWELSFDNDCILWTCPAAITEWLDRADPHRCLLQEDVRPCFGQFASLCGDQPRNTGIRGLPPGFDLERAISEVLLQQETQSGAPLRMTSELDEQGLQTAVLARYAPPLAVSLQDVTVCSPFYPHLPHLGRCGAHFVGLNARHFAWSYYNRPADDCMTEHWNRHHDVLCERVGAAREAPA